MLLNGDRGTTGLFRDGPTPALNTFDNGEFAFEYPADWLGYDASAGFSGGSSIAVLGTQAVEPRCGDERHVDINCVYEQPLEPGDVRVFVGTGALRGGTVLDRPDVEDGTTTRHTVAGMPAILDEYDPQPDSFYREDLSLQWSIGRPGLLSNVVRIELRAREFDGPLPRSVAKEAGAALSLMIASFRFDAAAIASPADPWAGKMAVGLPVVSVSDAIAIRDAGIDDREIAVHGWFRPIPMAGCPAQLEPTSPVQPACPDQSIWLTEQMDALTTVQINPDTWRPPTSPAVQPDLDLVDRSWFPSAPESSGATAIEVVFVGHFDDYRSSLCPRAEEDACRERFVVDRVDWVDGEQQPTSVLDLVEGTPLATPFDDVEAALDRITSGAPILSAVRVDGAVGLRGVEPSLGTGQAGLIDHDTLWVVRILVGDRAATYVVADGTDTFFEIDAAGTADQVGTAEPSSPIADTVFGRPVLSVPELIALRESPTREEVAVRGWALRSSVVYDCAIHMDPHHPLVPFCQPPIFLMEQPEMQVGSSTTGPSVPMLIGPDAHIQVEIPFRDPADIIAIGHFLDHRWSTCPETDAEACQKEFVVDRLFRADRSVEGLLTPWRVSSPASSGAILDLAASVARLETRIGDVTALSVGSLRGSDLAPIEPQATQIGQLHGRRSMWLVRALMGTDPTSRTFLLMEADGTDELEVAWELTADGPEELPPPPDPDEATPRPADPPNTPSPDGRIRVELWAGSAPDGEPVRVTIVDGSGLVTSAREVRPDDGPWIATVTDDAAVAVDGAGLVRLRWTGTVCDGPAVVTIAPDFETIDIDGGTRPACDAMAVGRQLVLETSTPVDGAAIRASYDGDRPARELTVSPRAPRRPRARRPSSAARGPRGPSRAAACSCRATRGRPP